MHPTIYAQRNAVAEIRLASQSNEIARIHGAEEALEEYKQEIAGTVSFSPEVASLLEKEARIKLNDAILAGSPSSHNPEDTPGPQDEGLEGIEGVGPESVQRLNEAGYYSKQDIRKAPNAELNKVKGVGPSTIKALRDATETTKKDAQ